MALKLTDLARQVLELLPSHLPGARVCDLTDDLVGHHAPPGRRPICEALDLLYDAGSSAGQMSAGQVTAPT